MSEWVQAFMALAGIGLLVRFYMQPNSYVGLAAAAIMLLSVATIHLLN